MKASRKPSVLIIDDDPSILMTVGDRLEFDGYEVLKAVSGEEGLERLASRLPDLVILDIGLPGMGGLAVLKAMSGPDGKPRCPVLVFTARAKMEQFFGGLDIDGFVAKPSDPDRLVAEVGRILETRRRTARPVARAPSEPLRVLIAEDDPYLGADIAEAFRAAGYDARLLADGQELIEAAVREPPDIVILKMILPHMNGTVVASILNSMTDTRDVPVLLYDASGHAKLDVLGRNVRRFVPCSAAAELVEAAATALRRA
jgi:DNA-binding response OmpR family regulator